MLCILCWRKSKTKNAVLTIYPVIFIYYRDPDVKWRIWISNGPLNSFESCIPFQLPEILIEIWKLGQWTFVLWRLALRVVWVLLCWNVTPNHLLFESRFEWQLCLLNFANRLPRDATSCPRIFLIIPSCFCCSSSSSLLLLFTPLSVFLNM